MPELQLVRLDHAPALLAFELKNRSYFAAAVPDRGDAYFAAFSERHQELLACQAARTDFFHVLVEEDGTIIGRINLYELADGSANLGYRIAEQAAGRGLATAAVRQVCELAVGEYGLRVLCADARTDNAASTAVLVRTGFVPTTTVTLNDNPGIRYRLELKPTKN